MIVVTIAIAIACQTASPIPSIDGEEQALGNLLLAREREISPPMEPLFCFHPFLLRIEAVCTTFSCPIGK